MADDSLIDLGNGGLAILIKKEEFCSQMTIMLNLRNGFNWQIFNHA
jgi:hypothetical protein